MPAQIETHTWCPQYWATFEVQGSRGSVYVVQLSGTSNFTCTCPSYQYFKGPEYDRECKHTKLVWSHACLYNTQWKDAGPNDLEEHGIRIVHYNNDQVPNDPCPGCNENMSPVRVAV